MKSLHLTRLILSAVSIAASVALGCGSSEGSGGGGHGGGPRCPWVEPDGGLTFPVCPAKDTSAFMGTLDGMPFDTKDSGNMTVMAPALSPPYQLSLVIGDRGSLDLSWGDPFVRGTWTPVNAYFIRPDTQELYDGYPESQLLYSCDDYAFFYLLEFRTHGRLTGCSR